MRVPFYDTIDALKTLSPGGTDIYEPDYTIHDIADAGGTTVRCVQRWIKVGVMPRPVSFHHDGRNYTYIHLVRAKKLRTWLDNQISLTEMAARIEIVGESALDVINPYVDIAEWPDLELDNAV